MDLKDLTPKSDSIEVEIKHPITGEALKNDDDTPMTITLHATHSKEYKSVMHEQTNRRLKAASATGKVDITSEELEENTLEVLAKATKSWNLTFGGEKPELTVDEAKKLYTEVFWIKDQLDEGISNSMGFMMG
jgi:hypothetical protein